MFPNKVREEYIAFRPETSRSEKKILQHYTAGCILLSTDGITMLVTSLPTTSY